jgi:beta-phosphoglucomutase
MAFLLAYKKVMKTAPELEDLKGIFFDMDGVLVDSMNHHLQSWKELLEYFSITVSDTFIFEHEGAMSSEVIRDIFAAKGYTIEDDQISAIYSWQNTRFQEEYLHKVDFYPQTLSLLRQLNTKGLQIGLVTSSRMNLVEKIWNRESLSLFSTIVTADDVERYKPNPDPYLKALSKIQQEAGHCLVIENAPAGIQAASAAGIPCYAIASTLPAEKLFGAQEVFSDLSALRLFLSRQLFS